MQHQSVGETGEVRWWDVDGISVIDTLRVSDAFRGQGVGRRLVYTVPCPLVMGCDAPVGFCERIGLRQDDGRWGMRVLNIIVRGGAKEVPDICRVSGSAYGSAEVAKPYAAPYMVDVAFENPDAHDWKKYMEYIRLYRPVQALVMDYFAPDKKEKMLAQVEDLRAAGVQRVVVCAKFHGAVKDIPQGCIVGVSLRTKGKLKGAGKFAGFMPNFAELSGRQCHLLGGAPSLQKLVLARLRGAGARVVSVDGNSQFGAAARGSCYVDGTWRRKGNKMQRVELATFSSINIQRELNAVTLTQPKLF